MTLFILGLDGATWDLLDPLMSAGLMPHLRALVDSGVRTRLRSTYPPVTALAWPSFFTGTNAGKHGAFSFVRRDRQGKEQIIDASQVQTPAIWDWLAPSKRRCGILGIPITYPTPSHATFAISGFLTPPHPSAAFTPPSLAAELAEIVGSWTFHVPPPAKPSDISATQSFIAALMAATEQRRRAIPYLLQHYTPDLFIAVLMDFDTIQHAYWGYLHPHHPFYQHPEAEPIRQMLFPAIRLIDSLIAEVAAAVLPDGNLVLISDHGFGPMHRRLALNNALAQHGFLKLRSGRIWLDRLRRRARRIRQRHWPQRADQLRHVKANQTLPQLIDWSHSRAFAGAAHELSIHLNRRDRFPHGIVSPAEAPDLLEEISKMLLGLRDEEGKPLIAAVYRPQDLFHGPQLAQAPDLFIRPADERDVVTDGLLRGKRLYRLEEHHAGGWHRLEGILLAAGAGFQQPQKWLQPPTLLDLAPIIFQLLGYQPPTQLDGRMLSEILKPSSVPLQPLPQMAEPSESSRQLTPAEQAELMKRLQGLGYMN